MSLAQLFYVKNHGKQCRSIHACRQRQYKPLPRRRSFFFESLEPRLLLSGSEHLFSALPLDPTPPLNTPRLIVEPNTPLTFGAATENNGAGGVATTSPRADDRVGGAASQESGSMAIEEQPLLNDPVAHSVGGSGNWSDPTHWYIGVVANNGGRNTYTAIINAVGSDNVVDVTQSITISRLVSSGTLHVGSGMTLLLQTQSRIRAI